MMAMNSLCLIGCRIGFIFLLIAVLFSSTSYNTASFVRIRSIQLVPFPRHPPPPASVPLSYFPIVRVSQPHNNKTLETYVFTNSFNSDALFGKNRPFFFSFFVFRNHSLPVRFRLLIFSFVASSSSVVSRNRPVARGLCHLITVHRRSRVYTSVI